MAFRNHKFSPVVSPPTEVYDEVLSSTIVDGVETPVIKSVPNSELSDKLPALSEYSLSDLMDAGVPLKPVSAKVIVSPESEVASIVDDVINNSPAPAVPADSEPNSEPA